MSEETTKIVCGMIHTAKQEWNTALADAEAKIEALKRERDCWIFNAKELQKQVNAFEQERASLKEAERLLCQYKAAWEAMFPGRTMAEAQSDIDYLRRRVAASDVNILTLSESLAALEKEVANPRKPATP